MLPRSWFNAVRGTKPKKKNVTFYGSSVKLNLTFDDFARLASCYFSKMNNQYSQTQDEATVPGFEVPRSPEASYNNVYPGNEDIGREPPTVPQHLHHTLLNHSTSRDVSESLPVPQNVTINHLYLENREPPRSVVALGVTHRFRPKYVTVVLYKPVQRAGSSSN